MKRFVYTALVLMLPLSLFAGCASAVTAASQQASPAVSETASFIPSAEPSKSAPSSKPTVAATPREIPNYSVPESQGVPAVYMTSKITPEGLQAVYEALGIKPDSDDKVAIKVSTGEPPSSNYLRQDLIGNFVKSLKGTYVECNTAYSGLRASTEMHYQVAAEHGFSPVVLMDDNGEMEIPIEGGLRLKTDTVGKRLQDFNFYVVLSHFKGHQMAGYGGALKQLSIGCASYTGKNLIHTAGVSRTSMFSRDQDGFLEAMADASKGVVGFIKNMKGGQVIYINVMNRLSIDCDCNGNPDEPEIHDIGILASTDPVALDEACIDLIYKADGNKSFLYRLEGLNGIHVIEAAEQIGLGSRHYTMVNIDD